MSFTRDRIQSRDASSAWSGLLTGRLAGGSTAGQVVNKTTVATVPAIHRAWTFAANAVAILQAGVYRGEGVVPTHVTTTPQARLFRGVPNRTQDWFRFWYIVQKSLEARNSAFIWKTRDSQSRVTALTALHPDQCFPYIFRLNNGGLEYPVLFNPWYPRPPDVEAGEGIVNVDTSVMLHIRGDGGIGELIPPTPIQQFATSIGIALAKQDYEAHLYENGILGGTAVVFPAGITEAQARQFKDIWNAENAGTGNAASTKVTGGGATITQIGMTQRDAQFVESGAMSTLDIANMTGVPAWVVNANEKTEKSMVPEQQEAQWVHHGLKTRLVRLQSAITADDSIFGPGSRDYLMFDTGNTIHPDLMADDQIAHNRVQDGRLLVDEWREAHGLPPLPDGLGMVPQIVPVGGAPNPVTTPTNGAEDA